MNQYSEDCPIAVHLRSVGRVCAFRRMCERGDRDTFRECGECARGDVDESEGD